MHQIKNLEKQNALFIVCPFCQLENFLRKNFGNDIYFMTAPAAVINFNKEEVYAIKDFLARERIRKIYLVNDVSCNFIEEAINHKKEFGLHCEKELRKLLKDINPIAADKDSLLEMKALLAHNNGCEQLKCLNAEKTFKHEIEFLGIKTQQLVLDVRRVQQM